MNMQKGAIAAMAVVAGLQGLPVMALAEPTKSGSGISTDMQHYLGAELGGNDYWYGDKDIHDGRIHLSYSTDGGSWQDPGQDATVESDNHSHANGTYLVTIPTKIHYQNMNIGKVDTSDDYTVNVRGVLEDGKQVTLTAETGKVVSNGDDTGITETTTQGKTTWTSDETFGGINDDGSLKGTDTTDNIKMSGEAKTAGQYEGSVAYTATLAKTSDGGYTPIPTMPARTADEITALQANPNNIASGTWGTCPWWISSDGTLNIEAGTGANATVGKNPSHGVMPWDDYAKQIKAFEGPSGGNKIVMPANSQCMFNGCSGLTSLDLSSLKTDNVTDMSGMFFGCSGLTSLDLTPLKTDNVTDMSGMFAGCSSLTSLDLSHLKTDKVTNMGGMFSGCSGLTSLDLTPLKTDNVTDMSYMFEGCSGLTSLDLTPLKTDNVTNMSWMFEGCSGLTSLDLSPLKTDKVTDMSYMFEGCSGLTSLDLTPLKTDNVTDMSYMFRGCSGLTSLNLTPLKTDNVTNMSWMFEGCSGLTSLDLTPLKTDNVTVMYGMFLNCSSLTSLDLTPLKTDKVTDMGFMFDGCSGLTSLRTGDDFGIKAANNKAALPKPMTMDGTTAMNSGDYLADGAHVYTAR